MMRINLIPPGERRKGEAQRRWTRLSLLFALVFFLSSLTMAYVASRRLDAMTAKIAAECGGVKTAEIDAADVHRLQEENAALEKLVGRLNDLLSGERPLPGSGQVLVLLRHLADACPDDLWLTRLRLGEEGQLEIGGTAIRAEAVSVLQRRLGQLAGLGRPRLVDITPAAGQQLSLVRFTLTVEVLVDNLESDSQ